MCSEIRERGSSRYSVSMTPVWRTVVAGIGIKAENTTAIVVLGAARHDHTLGGAVEPGIARETSANRFAPDGFVP